MCQHCQINNLNSNLNQWFSMKTVEKSFYLWFSMPFEKKFGFDSTNQVQIYKDHIQNTLHAPWSAFDNHYISNGTLLNDSACYNTYFWVASKIWLNDPIIEWDIFKESILIYWLYHLPKTLTADTMVVPLWTTPACCMTAAGGICCIGIIVVCAWFYITNSNKIKLWSSFF